MVVNPDVGAGNPDPLQEHPDLLTAEPSLKPLFVFKKRVWMFCLHVCMHSWSEEGVRSPGTGVRDGYKPLCGCWEVNPGPLQVQVL